MLFSRNLFVTLLAIAAVDASSLHRRQRDPEDIIFYCALFDPEIWRCGNDTLYGEGQCVDWSGSPFIGKLASFNLPSGVYCDIFE